MSDVPACEVTDLTMHFGPVRAVDGVSFVIRRGTVLGLVGESGSGKSTVGRCVTRLHRPTSGTVRLGGADVTTLSRRALRPHRSAVSMIFQDPAGSLDPRFTVGDVVGEPLRLQRVGRGDRRRRVGEMLEQVGLRRSVVDRYPHEMSGGQRQRVSLARALVARPSLLVADEPTSALDVSVQAGVLNLLTDLQAELGFACLFITHDLAVVEFLADEVAVMYLGTLVEHGPKDRLFSSPRHPYTQALLSAAPVADPVEQRRRRRVVLGGDLPSSVSPPEGCRFHTRCPLAVERCRTEVPALRDVGGVRVACHLVDGDGHGPDVRDTTAAEHGAGLVTSPDTVGRPPAR